MMATQRSVLHGMILAGWLLVGSAPAEDEKSELPKGYREVGGDKVVALQELCQATADTGLFTGAVLG